MMNEVQTVELEWDDDFRFEARAADVTVTLDGNSEVSLSPVNLLLAAVGACAGIDVVDILRKGRQEPRELKVTISGRRRSEPPRYVEQLHARFLVRGEVAEAKARRAADLSFEKYCSVFHTLRKDVETSWEVVVEP